MFSEKNLQSLSNSGFPNLQNLCWSFILFLSTFILSYQILDFFLYSVHVSFTSQRWYLVRICPLFSFFILSTNKIVFDSLSVHTLGRFQWFCTCMCIWYEYVWRHVHKCVGPCWGWGVHRCAFRVSLNTLHPILWVMHLNPESYQFSY